MIIVDTDSQGNTTFRRVEDLPSNYECPEWRAYDAACDEAQTNGEMWSENQATTYAAYRAAQERGFREAQ